DAIIEHDIQRVVIGCRDAYHEVDGKGIERMRKAGIQIDVGVLEQESYALNRRFFTFHKKQRPYIILKWAQTHDGFIDRAADMKNGTKGVWITDEICKKRVHEWRTHEQAILIGTNTAHIDNPQLTTRLVKGNNPLRLVIDLKNRLPDSLHIKDKSTPTIIFTQKQIPSQHNLEYVRILNSETMWTEIMGFLYTRNIQSLIIEGGARILEDVIEKNIWDEMRIFTGPEYFYRGIQAPHIHKKPDSTEYIGNSKLSIFFNDSEATISSK
ncbi:MAG TPA: dihydrofolate reductase family protein, partial [Bacteroidales bacterium]|nr:dihydrofolate reductase family protein [Bacteroidales bacterium]